MEKKESAGLMELAGLLTAARSYQETIEVIVSKSAEVLKSDRACLIIKTKEGKLRVESGVPIASHGIGTELAPETGEVFLNEVLAAKTPILLKDLSDVKVNYMSPLAKNYGITSLLAAPLYYEEEPVGILVLDFIQGHEISEENMGKVQYLTHLIAMAVRKEQSRQEDREKIRLSIIGENIARFTHIAGNKLFIIKGFSEQVHEFLSDGKYNDIALANQAKENMERIISAAKEIEIFMKSIKDFSKPKEFKPGMIDVNEFLEDQMMTLSKSGLSFIRFIFDLDFDIPQVKIDKIFMSDCVQDIIENAAQAMARNITIKSQFLKEEKKALISISNDGLKIDPFLVGKIFDLFKTTKENGTGLGLANVKTIVEKFHNGKVEVESDDKRTEFRIYLSLE